MMTNEELQQLCFDWQIRLRLGDWIVKARFWEPHEIDGSLFGQCSYLIQEKTAKIKIIRPEHTHKESFPPQIVEETLVHELLHLHFAPFEAKPKTTKMDAQELAINCISRALVKLAKAN
jgi:hypothetical protein